MKKLLSDWNDTLDRIPFYPGVFAMDAYCR